MVAWGKKEKELEVGSSKSLWLDIACDGREEKVGPERGTGV